MRSTARHSSGSSNRSPTLEGYASSAPAVLPSGAGAVFLGLVPGPAYALARLAVGS